MINKRLSGFTRCISKLALVLGVIPVAVQAELDFSAFSCTEGDLISTLPNNNNRVMVQLYHNGYLISHDHASGVMRSFDMTNPYSPVQVGGDKNIGNAGHHHFMGVGNIIGFNWAGLNQTRLDDVPNFTSASIVDGTSDAFMVGDGSNGHHSEIVTFYPIGFGNVPTAYEFDNKPVLTIHDMSKPGNPEIGSINVIDDLGFQGRVNMVGNLLIVRGDNLTGYGVGVYDISDPANPRLLDKIRQRSTAFGGQLELGRAYDTMPMFENYIVNAMNSDTGFQRSVDIIDYSDPTNLVHVSSSDYSGPSMRYPNFKDDHMYVGEAKVDMRTFKEVASFPSAYGEFLLPLGNLLVGSGQYRTGTSKVFCNEGLADTRAPEVGFTWPRPGATGLHVNSRIGVLIHETLDINTINDSNFQIRKTDGTPIPVHVSWWSNGTINVTPKSPLDAGTTYKFFMRANGVKDVAGNGLESNYAFIFSTDDGGEGGNQSPVINDITLSSSVAYVGQATSINVSAADPQGDGLTYDIDWGDGGGINGNASTYNHTYTQAGLYFVNVEVSDNLGNTDTQVIQVVVEENNLAQHLNSSSIVYDEPRNRLLNVNPDNNTITAVDASSGAKIFERAVGKDPRGIAVAANGEIWVTNYDDATLSVLNTNGNLMATLGGMSPGAKPFGILISPDQKYVYVSNEGAGNIVRFDRATRKKLNTLYVGPFPHAMAMTGDGETLLVTRFISPKNEAHIYKVNLNDFTASSKIKIAADTTSLDTNTSSRGVMNYLMGITIMPGSDVAWVVGKKDNTFRGLAVDGNFGNFQNTVRSIIAKVDISANAEVPNSKFDIDNAEIASAITFSQGGDIVYITHQGNNRLSAYNVSNMQGLDQIEIGAAPKGIAVASSGQVFTHNFLSRTVSRLNLFTGTAGTVSALAELSNTPVVSNERLNGEVLEGKRIFYSSADPRLSLDGYLSCAACHNDGGHDGRTRDFTDRGEGLRNTTTLEGRAGIGHGRVHWSANFDEIQDFEHDIRFAFLGGGLMAQADFNATDTTLGEPKAGLSDDLDNLNAYVTSLNTFTFSPHRKWNGALRGAGPAGKAIFEAKGCAKCHGGDAYTDSPQGNRHDVGTISENSGLRLGGMLNGIDTPTLRGIWSTEPYLHDGSANSLSDVLMNEKHLNAGSTDTGLLNDSDRAALIEFLKQIDSEEPAATAVANPININTVSHGQSIDGDISLGITTSLSGISEVQFVVNDMVIATLNSAPYQATYSPASLGLHRVYARAVYNAGRVATLSPELTVRVTSLAGSGATSSAAAGSEWFFIANLATGKKLAANGSVIAQAEFSITDDSVQWRKVATDSGFYYIENKATGKYFKPAGNVDNAVIDVSTNTGWAVQWSDTNAGNGCVYMDSRSWDMKLSTSGSSVVQGDKGGNTTSAARFEWLNATSDNSATASCIVVASSSSSSTTPSSSASSSAPADTGCIDISTNTDYTVTSEEACFRIVSSGYKYGALVSFSNKSAGTNILRWMGSNNQNVEGCENTEKSLSGNNVQHNNFPVGDSAGYAYVYVKSADGGNNTIRFTSVQNWQNGSGCN